MNDETTERETKNNTLNFHPEKERQRFFEIDYEGLRLPDVELLMDKREITDGALNNARTRIRNRLLKTMLSFIAVERGLSERDYELLGNRVHESWMQEYSLYYGLLCTVVFALRVAKAAKINDENLIEHAIEQAELGVVDAEVDIEKFTSRHLDVESIKKKIEMGETIGLDEIGWLTVQNALSKDELETIQNEGHVIAYLSTSDDLE